MIETKKNPGNNNSSTANRIQLMSCSEPGQIHYDSNQKENSIQLHLPKIPAQPHNKQNHPSTLKAGAARVDCD
jgi:hypothetical protein